MTKDDSCSLVRRSLDQDRLAQVYSSRPDSCSSNLDLKSLGASMENRWSASTALHNNEEEDFETARISAASPVSSVRRRLSVDSDEDMSTLGPRAPKTDFADDSISDNESTQAFDPKSIGAPVNGCKKRKLYHPLQHEIVKAINDDGKHSTGPSQVFGEFGSLQERLNMLQHRFQPSSLKHLTEEPDAKRLVQGELVSNRQSSLPLPLIPNMLRPALNHLSQNSYLEATKQLLVEQKSQLKTVPPKTADLDLLGEMLKRELASSLAQLIDDTLTRFTAQQQLQQEHLQHQQQHNRNNPKVSEDVTSKHKARIIDRGLRNGDIISFNLPPAFKTPYFAPFLPTATQSTLNPLLASSAGGFTSLSSSVNYAERQSNIPSPHRAQSEATEQDEAISLVVSSRNDRAKVTENMSPSPVESFMSSSPNHDSKNHNTPSPPRSPTPPLSGPIGAPNQAPLLGNPNLLSAYFAAAAAAAAASTARSVDAAPILHPGLLSGPPSGPFRHFELGGSSPDSSEVAHCYDGFHQMFTLTPMHLRKAKLMFFWVRYPSSSVLKAYFPDVKFNKNNTAQLVKWFSNFREFYYIQMEKYSRQLLSEGLVNAEDIHVSVNSELFRVLNLHYNRNNHIEVPAQFVLVVTQTMREFFKAIQARKDCEPSWKKAIYKIIARLDEPLPDFFRSPNFLERFDG